MLSELTLNQEVQLSLHATAIETFVVVLIPHLLTFSNTPQCGGINLCCALCYALLAWLRNCGRNPKSRQRFVLNRITLRQAEAGRGCCGQHKMNACGLRGALSIGILGPLIT